MKKLIAGVNALVSKLKNLLTKRDEILGKIASGTQQKKERVKKFVKDYFCFWNFALGSMHFIFFFLILISSWIINDVFDLGMSFSTPFIIAFFITLGHFIIALTLRLIYIEMPDDELRYPNYEILVVNEQPKILYRPTWGKGRRYVVEGTKISDYKAVLEYEITCDYGKTTVSVPLIVTLNFKESFNKIEVFNALLTAQKSTDTLYLKTYVKSFIHLDSEINTATAEYVLGEISCPTFLNRIANFITFPEKPFSNVESVNIHLKEPEFSADNEL